jgi:hypothetical protein
MVCQLLSFVTFTDMAIGGFMYLEKRDFLNLDLHVCNTVTVPGRFVTSVVNTYIMFIFNHASSEVFYFYGYIEFLIT